MAAYFLDGRVVYILVHPTASNFKEIADALVERKGPPSKTITANNAEVFGQLTWQRLYAELFYAEKGIQGKSWLSLISTYGDEKLKTRRTEIAARKASAAKKDM